MKTNEIRGMTSEELGSKLVTLRGELFNLRFQHATGNLTNPMSLNTIKKDIAKIKTILTERELNINTDIKGTKKAVKKTDSVKAGKSATGKSEGADSAVKAVSAKTVTVKANEKAVKTGAAAAAKANANAAASSKAAAAKPAVKSAPVKSDVKAVNAKAKGKETSAKSNAVNVTKKANTVKEKPAAQKTVKTAGAGSARTSAKTVAKPAKKA